MSKSLMPRFTVIFLVLGFSFLLLYPTLGPKTMVVEFNRNTAKAKLEKIASYYQKQGYEVQIDYKQIADNKDQTDEGFSNKKEDLKEKSQQKNPVDQDDNNAKTNSAATKALYHSLTFRSFKITLALANAIRINPEVENIVIKESWIEDVLLAKPIKLGLDLQGGMHLLLQADYKDILRKLREDKIISWKQENYNEKGTAPKKKDGARVEDLLILEEQLPDEKKAELIDEWKKERTEVIRKDENKNGKKIKLRSEPIVLTLTEKEINDAKQQVIIQAREILNKRIDKTGVSEPSIRVLGSDSIEIQLPGVPNPKQAKQIIGSTGMVSYKLVDMEATNDLLKKVTALPERPITDKEYDELREKMQSLLPRQKTEKGIPIEVDFLLKKNKDGKYVPDRPYVLESPVMLKGDDIDKAWVGSTEETMNAVHFRLTSEGSEKFANLTGNNKGRHLAVIIDDRLYSGPPVIRDKIAGGQAYISGDFNREEADTLASIINEGALPVKLSIIEERTVGPSLGVESIESGMEAVIISFFLVLILMMIRYKVSGLVATFGLFSNFLILGALLAWLGATLTLPGIAGLILTLGMAVDANVIIFERIREELKLGKSVRAAISNGFDKAFSTILDSNLTTLIAALVLSRLGTGPIKGFAVTLSVGIVSSMFTALYITRFIYDVLSARKELRKLSI